MVIEVLIGLLGFVSGIAITALTFGITQNSKISKACADIANLSNNMNAHINSPPRECLVHAETLQKVEDNGRQIAVNSTRLDQLERNT